MNDNVLNTFNQEKLLARAMDWPNIRRVDGELVYDFSVWAEECEIAKQQELTSLSSTLLLPGEPIHTYKSIGFLIDSDKTNVIHVSEYDSGSSGNVKTGDFFASGESLESLNELSKLIHHKHEKSMNEINVNMAYDAYLGLFINKCLSESTLSRILLAQIYFKLHNDLVLPIYVYDDNTGNLVELDMKENDKVLFLQVLLEKGVLKTSSIYYELENGESKKVNFLNSIEKLEVNISKKTR